MLQRGEALEALLRADEMARRPATGRGAGAASPKAMLLLMQAKAHAQGGEPSTATEASNPRRLAATEASNPRRLAAPPQRRRTRVVSPRRHRGVDPASSRRTAADGPA